MCICVCVNWVTWQVSGDFINGNYNPWFSWHLIETEKQMSWNIAWPRPTTRANQSQPELTKTQKDEGCLYGKANKVHKCYINYTQHFIKTLKVFIRKISKSLLCYEFFYIHHQQQVKSHLIKCSFLATSFYGLFLRLLYTSLFYFQLFFNFQYLYRHFYVSNLLLQQRNKQLH